MFGKPYADMTSVLIVTTVLLIAFLHLAMGFRIEITPDRYMEASRGGVKVQCILDTSDKCAHEAAIILGVSKEGESPLAFVQQPSSIDYDIESPKVYHVQGHIDQNYRGSLNVTFPNPENDHTGMYSCVIYCRYNSGVAVEGQVSRKLIVNIFDVQHTLVALETKVTTLTTKVMSLESDLNKERMKASYTTAFSATLTSDVTVSPGGVVVFGEVLVNEGNGYDKLTGVFTVPRKGLYAFHLTMFTRCGGCWAEVNIKADDVILATTRGHDNDDMEQTAVSGIAELEKGAKVKSVALATSQLYGRSTIWRSMFSGYLVKLL